MNRREIIRSMSLVSAHALFPSILTGFVASCASKPSLDESSTDKYTPLFFSSEEFDVIKQVVDIILPATKSASASQVNTHHFVDEVFAKCLSADQQSLIKDGLSVFVNEFNSASSKEQLLLKTDQGAFSNNEALAWFMPIKQYTLIGFFTSQEGTTKASNYDPIPGDYKGDIPMDESTLNYGFTKQRYYL